MKEEGRKIVFWSGGNDSTLLALRLLREREYVHLVSFVSYHIGGFAQQNKEKIYRKYLLHKFKEDFGDSFKYTEISWEAVLTNGQQHHLWCALAPTILQSKDELYFGFLKYDDVWHKIEKFKQSILTTTDFFGLEEIKLEFPLEWMQKSAVRKELKKYGYLDNTIISNDSIETEWVKAHNL